MHTVQLLLMTIFKMKTTKTKKKNGAKRKKKLPFKDTVAVHMCRVYCMPHACVCVCLEEEQKK